MEVMLILLTVVSLVLFALKIHDDIAERKENASSHSPK